MGWWITLGILVLLAIMPLGVSVRYDEHGAEAKLIAGPVRIILYPRPKKDKKPKKEEKKPVKQPAEPKPKEEPEKPTEEPTDKQEAKPSKKSGGPITDFLPLVQIVLDMLDAFGRKLRVNVLELKLIMAADDPCDLAVNYGRAWAAVGNLLPQLEKRFVIKKRNIEVECDFQADQTRVIARLDLTITLGRIIGTTLFHGGRAGLEFMKIIKKRKGGASE